MLTCQTVLKQIPANSQKVYIAYSGGLDSHVLLHLCASSPELKTKITAVYIHHGLQAVADDWLNHCQVRCEQLNVNYLAIKVDATAKVGESPEAAARAARYAAFQALIQPNEVILLAHHREDQMETLFLQLFRGAGVNGLAAMPKVSSFVHGSLIRPLLDIGKSELQHYAHQHQLTWVEDPSNACNDFDRNFLRNQVLPLLKTRWPSCDKTIARSATHCANASEFINDWVMQHLPEMIDQQQRSLSISQWLRFSEQQQNWLLRHWLQTFGLKPPSQAVLQTLVQQVINAKTTALPELVIQDFYIKKFQDKLYCLPASYFTSSILASEWPNQQSCYQLANEYQLVVVAASQGIDAQIWASHRVTIQARQGGEKMKLPNRAGHHSLKKLYQEAGIPPWERDMRPLIYLNNRLAAVAGLWVAEWVYQAQQACYKILWEKR